MAKIDAWAVVEDNNYPIEERIENIFFNELEAYTSCKNKNLYAIECEVSENYDVLPCKVVFEE